MHLISWWLLWKLLLLGFLNTEISHQCVHLSDKVVTELDECVSGRLIPSHSPSCATSSQPPAQLWSPSALPGFFYSSKLLKLCIVLLLFLTWHCDVKLQVLFATVWQKRFYYMVLWRVDAKNHNVTPWYCYLQQYLSRSPLCSIYNGINASTDPVSSISNCYRLIVSCTYPVHSFIAL